MSEGLKRRVMIIVRGIMAEHQKGLPDEARVELNLPAGPRCL